MNRKIRLVEIELTTHCHATEDIEKVKQAVLNAVPEQLRMRVDFLVQELKGYYGNPIIRITTSFKDREAEEVLKYIVSRLSPADREYLMLSLEQRYDRKSNKLYLRLNKQEAYLGNLVLYDGSDAIRVVASFSIIRSVDEVRRYLEEIVKEFQGEQR